MKKLTILFFFVLLVVPISLGSTPRYTINVLLDNDVKNGQDIDLGDILFLESSYESEIYHTSSIINRTIQQYDLLQWNSNKSARITDLSTGTYETLLTGERYHFTNVFNHIINFESEPNSTSIISVIPKDPNYINITDIVVPTGMELKFSENNFTLLSEKSISAKLNVDDDVNNGQYDLKYKVNGNQQIKTINVLKNINWTINFLNISQEINIKSGKSAYLGRVVLENIGNQDVEISITKTGNGTSLINSPKPQTLFKKNIINFDFQISAPTIMKSGIYSINLIVAGDTIVKRVPINITVKDCISPIIESISFSSNKVFVNNEIKVISTDNDETLNVTIEYDGDKYYLNKDKNLFTGDFTFNKLSRYIMNFCALDREGNKECLVVNKTFVKVDVIGENSRVLEMDSMRYGKYSKIQLFNLTEDINDTTIEIIDYTTIPFKTNNSPIFRIIDEDGSIKTFGKYDKEIKIEKKGMYFLEIRTDEEMKIDGVIRLNMPEQYQEIEDMTFKVEFKDFDVPKDFAVQWTSGRDFVCVVEDTGSLSTSYYDCSIKYPIETRESDISVPTTVAERDGFENKANLVREELSDSKKTNGRIITILCAILLIIILWASFMIYFYPYFAFVIHKRKAV